MQRNRRTPIRAIFRVLARYRRAHGRYPNILSPSRFTEKMQWRKLFDRDPFFEVLCDKLACRDHIEARLGPGLQPELLWKGEDPAAIPFERFVAPYVVKCTHGSGMNILVEDPGTVDRNSVRSRIARWQTYNHGARADEPGYANLTGRILVEAMLTEPDGALPVEYKFLLFDGRVALIFLRINADAQSHANLFLRADWSPVAVRFDAPLHPGPLPARPDNLDAMLAMAERLGAGFDHIRIDFLVSRGKIHVGELTVYSFGGMVPADPDAFDLELGQAWRIKAPFIHALAAILGLARPVGKGDRHAGGSPATEDPAAIAA